MLLSTALTSLLATTAAAATYTVQVGNGGLTYTPSTLNITVGDTVQFTFISNPHTVTAGSGCVIAASPLFNATSDFDQQFSQPGSWPYFCLVGQHCQLGMQGVINVASAAAGSNNSQSNNSQSITASNTTSNTTSGASSSNYGRGGGLYSVGGVLTAAMVIGGGYFGI